ncbi:hypothetical protein RCG23_00860 [Neobacillus sp. PS3-34]|uniref:ATP synthase beta subunit C-terminal domain-containing protein n=1 Tax=Neobacillus sp. PS3-34 TaxID=3070678 RepID=UPI0027E1EA0A|nr:hypothetical protein [Neobacillus sp. PS3-34]WML48730.1 hypothetical protein RCG23_00860 [Neobacillus sp. PS3-34]
MIETKIKTIDFFAPISKGGTVGLVAKHGMGQVVVLTELFYRLKRNGYVTVLLYPQEKHQELEDLIADVDIAATSPEGIFEGISSLEKEGHIAFAADREHELSGELLKLKGKLMHSSTPDMTTFLFDLSGAAMDETLPFGKADTVWQFDAYLTSRHKFPAINPFASTSSKLDKSHQDQSHQNIKQRAQELLHQYRELQSLVEMNGLKEIPASELHIYQRGERLEAYLTQPFYVTEPYTGKKGESVDLQTTINDVRKILDGEKDSSELETLAYIGCL